ncbi:MAG: hypothetical protein ABSH34_07200 [Verrucomicrobiota bacterium]|jgi:hypothetical protein
MKTIPRHCVVDTNVAVVANGRSGQAGDSLVEKCIDAILELAGRGGLVLDDGGLIFDEYRQNLSLSGQPGTGDAFMKWVHDHQWNPGLCERRTITCLDEDGPDFNEFPRAEALRAFDRSDRKFVAVANARKPKRPILEAVDFKWWGWKDALSAEGIRVVFLDEQAAEAGYRKHAGHG